MKKQGPYNPSQLTLVWDGQFGSTGKGQIAAHIPAHDIAVRVGGPNAGHTFYHKGNKYVVQSIPVAAMLGAQGVIGAAGLVLEEQLLKELEEGYRLLGRPVELLIDRNAAVIQPMHMKAEALSLTERIGSTGEGVGAATSDKIWRVPQLTIAGQGVNFLMGSWSKPFVEGVSLVDDTASLLNQALLVGRSVMIEGTQGFGLSLHTGGFYPFCTSRECTPMALLAETGVGPHNAGHVDSIMVVRTYPIRVGGNSGPLKGEVEWADLKEATGGYISEPERTTVTKKIRRIAAWDDELFDRAVRQCGPTGLAVMFLDYLWPELAGCTDRSTILSIPACRNWLLQLQDRSGVPVQYVGTGAGRTATMGLGGVA